MNADRLNEIREARAVAHSAVTEGIDLKYLDRLRKQTYAMCDLAESLQAALDAAEQRLAAERHAADCTIYNAQPPWRCSCGLDAAEQQAAEENE